jgi:hypothetical protein
MRKKEFVKKSYNRWERQILLLQLRTIKDAAGAGLPAGAGRDGNFAAAAITGRAA